MAYLDLSFPLNATRSGALFSVAMQAFALHRQRQALRRLDDRALADIGISRAEAEQEAARPIWDVPATWRR
jgi:uncharacterized protein YjiS (DUF1127 family)